MPEFDERDAALLRDRTAARLRTERRRDGRPLVGDLVRFADGSVGRFTHAYRDAIQTTCRSGRFGLGSFYLLDTGSASYSGALDPSVPYGRLRDTGERRPARFWFFHHDYPCAHNGVDVDVPCRVFEELPGDAEGVAV